MPAPVETGQILAGKYRVESILGEGGMGVVVAATDVQLERRVAIKFLLPEYAQHHEASLRFMREARAAVKIQSEHIARVIDVNQMENGSPYMVMQFLEGDDLSKVLEQRGTLPIEEATAFVIQACDAIAEAHSYGIVHRDLKPANLFLARQADNSFKVKVLDFGISKTTVPSDSGFDASLTRTSSMMGSPLYMSPEQMKSTRDVDSRTDIWALGVILYELLAGKLPFTGNSVPELSAKILLEPPIPIQQLQPGVPDGLATIVMRALEKDPAARYPTISEFALDLLAYAPRKSRAVVERITRLMQHAGLSSSSMDNHSVVPASDQGGAGSAQQSSANRSAAAAQSGVGGPTVAEFGGTTPEIPTTGLNKWVVIGAVAALAAVGGGVMLVMNSSGPQAEAAATTEEASAEPLPAPPPPEPEVTPVEEAEEEVKEEASEDAPSEADDGKKEPAPASATPPVAAKPQVQPRPAVQPRPVKRTTTRAKTVAKPSTTTKQTTKTRTTTGGGFTSKFGGRK